MTPTRPERDPDKAATVRDDLIELITSYYDEDGADVEHRGGRA